MKAFFKAKRIWIQTQKPGRLSAISVKICNPFVRSGVLEKQMQKNITRGRVPLLEEFSSTSFNDHSNYTLAVAAAAQV